VRHFARIYGLNICSELPLYQQRSVALGATTDLEVDLGAPIERTDEIPDGRLLLHLQTNKQFYSAVATDGGYLLRFYGSCDITFDPELTRATVRPVHAADLDVISVLVTGTALAFVLSARGLPVLHASAVQVDQGAVAFVGGSGMGKSTVATLLCARGARLITDDMLSLDLRSSPPACRLGATELRLRKAAQELSEQFEAAPGRRRTGDARDALATPVAEEDHLPLLAIVVPLPDRSGEDALTELRLLPRRDALLLLSRFPRLLGWQDKEMIRRHFDQLGGIVAEVPVYLASLPWGPPFPTEMVDGMLRGIGLTVNGTPGSSRPTLVDG
jgi:hypothetical protein